MVPYPIPDYTSNVSDASLRFNTDLNILETVQCELFVVIHNWCDSRVLTLSSPCGQLPCLFSKPHAPSFFFEKTSLWLPLVREHFNLPFDVALLRCLWYKRYNEKVLQNHIYRAIVVTECQDERSEAPEGMQWVEASQLNFPPAALRDAADHVSQFVKECEGGDIPRLRPLFARREWYRNAVDWMRPQLEQNGFGKLEEVVELECAWRGCVLKAQVCGGAVVFLKCSSFFVNEALVSSELAKLIPKYVSTPIAVDVEKHLLLLRDEGEIVAAMSLEGEESKLWVKTLADIHLSTINETETLLRTGLKMLSIDVIEAKLPEVIAFAEKHEIVDASLIARFRELSTEISKQCHKLKSLEIPSTFVHGDLYFSNIFRQHGQGEEKAFGIIDFSEASISHPFIDTLGCNNRNLYFEYWIPFVQKKFPKESIEITSKHFRDYIPIATNMGGLRNVVRLYEELKDSEMLPAPQLLDSIRGELHWIKRQVELYSRRQSERTSQ